MLIFFSTPAIPLGRWSSFLFSGMAADSRLTQSQPCFGRINSGGYRDSDGTQIEGATNIGKSDEQPQT